MIGKSFLILGLFVLGLTVEFSVAYYFGLIGVALIFILIVFLFLKVVELI